MRPWCCTILLVFASCSEPFECTRHDECGACGVCENGVCSALLCGVDPGVDASNPDVPIAGADGGTDAQIHDADADTPGGDASGADASSPDVHDAGSRDAWTAPVGPLDPTFKISELTLDDCRTVTATVPVGGGLGFVASSSRLLSHAGNQLVSFDFEQSRGQTHARTTQEQLVGDLATGRVYTFLYDPNPALGVRRLVELDPITGETTANQVVLSMAIPIGFQWVGVYSGLGRATIQDGTSGGRLYDVDLSTGDVTDVGAAPAIILAETPGSSVWGVREYFDGSIHLVRVVWPSTVIRHRVSNGEVTTLRRFTWLNDVNFAIVPQLRRWYATAGFNQFHYSDSSFGLTHCQARFSAPSVLELSTTTPAGGSATITMPTVNGTAEPSATVQIFTDSRCAGPPIGIGTADTNGVFEIQVPAGALSATTFFANAVRPNGNVTFCFPGPTYFHDTAAPAFGGAIQAYGEGTSISVLWNQAFDDRSAVRYEICSSTTQGGCASAFVPVAYEPGPGPFGGTLTNLAPNTTYYLAARALDEAGNASGGTIERTATTGVADPGSLRVLHVDTNDCSLIDHDPPSNGSGNGYDMGAADQRVVFTGISETLSYRSPDLGDLSIYSRRLYYLLSDLGSDRLYTLTLDGNEGSYNGEVNTLEELDPTTGSTILSTPLTDFSGAPYSFYPGPLVFDGVGRAIVFASLAASSALEIDLATAVVTDVGPMMPAPPPVFPSFCGRHGIVESFGGQTYLLFISDVFEVSRYRLADGAVFPVASLPPYAYVCRFTVSPSERRMYWYGTAFQYSLEALGSCPMSFDQP